MGWANHQESGFIESIQSLLRIHLESMRKKKKKKLADKI
jgi:hypothetical protein